MIDLQEILLNIMDKLSQYANSGNLSLKFRKPYVYMLYFLNARIPLSEYIQPENLLIFIDDNNIVFKLRRLEDKIFDILLYDYISRRKLKAIIEGRVGLVFSLPYSSITKIEEKKKTKLVSAMIARNRDTWISHIFFIGNSIEEYIIEEISPMELIGLVLTGHYKQLLSKQKGDEKQLPLRNKHISMALSILNFLNKT